MIRLALISFLLVFSSNAVKAAVDPMLLDLVPANAEVLYGVNVQPLVATNFGKVAYARVMSNNPSIDRFAALVGMDPKRDVHELLLVTLPPSVPKLIRYDLVLARGSFRVDRFLSAARVSGASVTEDHGVATIAPLAGTLRQTVMFLDSSTVVVGPVGALRELVARRTAKTVFVGPLRQRATAVSASNDMWFASTGAPVAQVFGNRSWVPAAMVSSVHELFGGAKFHGESATLSAEAITASEALSQLGVQALNAATRLVKNARTLPLKEAQFSANGPAIRANLLLNDADLERLLLKPVARKSVMAGVR